MPYEPTYGDLVQALQDVVTFSKRLLTKAVEHDERIAQHMDIYEKASLMLNSARFLQKYPHEAEIEERASMEAGR